MTGGAAPKVLVFTDASSDGGAGRYLDYLFRVFERMGVAGTLASADPAAAWSGFPSIRRVRALDIGAAGAELVNVLQNLPEGFAPLVAEVAPDLVVFSDSCCIANLGPRLYCAEAGIPAIPVEHDCNPMLAPRMAEDHWRKLAASVAASPLVLTVSDFGVETLAGTFGYPRARLRRVHNPVLDDFFAPRDASARAAVRAEFGIADDERLAVSIAHVVDYKGVGVLFDLLVSCAEALRRRRLRFVWAGAGSLLEAARDGARRHGVDDLAVFPGWRGDPGRLLDAADLFVHLSLNEIFGISVAEAMARGVPVLAHDIGGVPEVVGDAGVLVSPRGGVGDSRPALLAGIDAALAGAADYAARGARPCGGDVPLRPFRRADGGTPRRVVAPGLKGTGYRSGPRSPLQCSTARTVRRRRPPSRALQPIDWPTRSPSSAVPTGVSTEMRAAAMSASAG